VLAGAIASDNSAARDWLDLYLERLRHVKTSLDGEALQQIGMSPGPRLGEMLGALLQAKLDGLVKTRADELEFVRTRLAGGQ